jgi:tRNA threonylcarbamoyladenosine biosynthesis protein TsaE
MRGRFVTRSEAETLGLAAEFACMLRPGDVVALVGDLGSGKTVFTKGVAAGLGVCNTVTSPTFTLIQEYRGRIPLHHMDLYRLRDIREILDIGVDEYFFSDGVCLIEWAEKLGDRLPDHAVIVTICHLDDHTREIEIRDARGPQRVQSTRWGAQESGDGAEFKEKTT